MQDAFKKRWYIHSRVLLQIEKGPRPALKEMLTGTVLVGKISGAMASGRGESERGLGLNPQQIFLTTPFFGPYFSTEIGHLYTKKL